MATTSGWPARSRRDAMMMCHAERPWPGTRTDLGDADVEWIHLLVSEWQLLSDLSFADLVLWVPTRADPLVSLAQMRPNTGPTSYQDDMVGRAGPARPAAMLDVAWAEGRIVREGDPEWRGRPGAGGVHPGPARRPGRSG